jgi:hypothetical protein
MIIEGIQWTTYGHIARAVAGPYVATAAVQDIAKTSRRERVRWIVRVDGRDTMARGSAMTLTSACRMATAAIYAISAATDGGDAA